MIDLNAKALEAIFQVSQCFKLNLDSKQTLARILEILEERLGYHKAVVALFDRESNSLLVEVAHGLEPERQGQVRYKKGEGITGLIVKTQKPLTIRRIGDDPRFLNRLGMHDPNHCFIGVPILDREHILGVLTTTLDAKEHFRLDEHEKIVVTLANLIGSVLSRLVRHEQETLKIQKERQELKSQLKDRFNPQNMVGRSRLMEQVFETLRQVALWDATVLVRGESGTGKEGVARAIHYQSPRSNGPLVKVNCAALPDNLLESELFGYEKGAFTGAVKRKLGRFEMAHQGTIYLDEIGDTSPSFQTKLLRVLQEGEFERLGGEETIKVDVRVVAATNVNLEQAVAERHFREDLYYRLNVMPIFLPPLRDRKEDIPLLVEHFLTQLRKDTGRELSITGAAMQILEQCDFPGNVRELENCVHRCAITAKDGVIAPTDLPCTTGNCMSAAMHKVQTSPAPMSPGQPMGMGMPSAAPAESVAVPTSATSRPLNEIANERDRVIAALQQAGWVQAKAARLLNMTPRQIAYRLKKLNIQVEQF
ncbi:MAG: nif-specific transcriptional activator NifA [bacterium]|nr:nif-specific transcriptional activator NifA [bacterium]